MVLAKALTGSIEGYWKVDHPAQAEIRKYIALFSEYPDNDIEIGIDGCGVPVFAVPLKNIAIAFMKLANPEALNDTTLQQQTERLTQIMNRHSPMLRGINQVCDVFNRDVNIVAKGGAQGVYAFGMKKEKKGAAFKLENGPEKFWPVMVYEMLKQLEYSNPETMEAMRSISTFSIYNDNKDIIGNIRPVFEL